MFPSDSDDKTALENVPTINFYHTTGWPQTQRLHVRLRPQRLHGKIPSIISLTLWLSRFVF